MRSSHRYRRVHVTLRLSLFLWFLQNGWMDEERLQGVGAYELKKLSVQNEKNSTRLYKLKPATTMITFRFCIEKSKSSKSRLKKWQTEIKKIEKYEEINVAVEFSSLKWLWNSFNTKSGCNLGQEKLRLTISFIPSFSKPELYLV